MTSEVDTWTYTQRSVGTQASASNVQTQQTHGMSRNPMGASAWHTDVLADPVSFFNPCHLFCHRGNLLPLEDHTSPECHP